MGLTRNLLGVVNMVGLLLSIPLLGGGIWLLRKQDTECLGFMEWPLVLLGALLLLISAAGFAGAVWRVTSLLSVYLFGIVIIILLLLALSIFGLVVTTAGPASSSGYRDYHVGDYSPWFRSQVNDVYTWRKIKNCIRGQGICQNLQNNYYYSTANSFYNERLSSIEYGCCMPPPDCGFQYVNPINWVNPSNLFADSDCSRWSNTESQLCYDCDTCRGSVLAGVKQEWGKVTILCIVVLVGLIVLYIIACCAVQSARSEELFKHYRRGF